MILCHNPFLISRHGLKASFGLSLSGLQYGFGSTSFGVMSTLPSDKEVGGILIYLCVGQNPSIREGGVVERGLSSSSSNRFEYLI